MSNKDGWKALFKADKKRNAGGVCFGLSTHHKEM